MRQIHVCAWMMLTLAACSGGEFSSPSATGLKPTGQSSAGSTSAAPTSGDAGEASTDQAGAAAHDGGQASGGGSAFSAGSPNVKGGSASVGGASVGGGSSGAVSGAPAENLDDCPDGTITFRMRPSPKLSSNYLCDVGCGSGWLSITDRDGAVGLPISSACGTASCETCEVRQCAAAACLSTPLGPEGSELTWDGTYLVKDTCGASKLACQRRTCVKPGKYLARACAALSDGQSSGDGCTPREERLCREVEFEFPATKTVELVLGE